jgi:hypothetical protein
MAQASRAAQRRALHERFRRDRKFFYSKRKTRQLRIHDGGGKDHHERKVWYVAPPYVYTASGLSGTRVTAERAEKIESKLKRGIPL